MKMNLNRLFEKVLREAEYQKWKKGDLVATPNNIPAEVVEAPLGNGDRFDRGDNDIQVRLPDGTLENYNFSQLHWADVNQVDEWNDLVYRNKT